MVAAASMCAALYAIGSYMTAYISSPWGSGQFRPAVVVPSLFATVFGPMPAAVGAALGTLIADSAKYGYLYPGSLLAAVPGNFLGFFMFGYILRRRFSWGRYVLASNLTLTVANALVAFLYVFLFKVMYLADLKYMKMATDVLVATSIGLTIWWFVTMLPFVLLVTPVLVRVVVWAVPSVVPEHVRTFSLKEELPKGTFSLALLVPGLIMLVVGLATTYTSLGIYTNIGAQTMFYASGAVLSVLGVLVYTRKTFLLRGPSPEKKDAAAR